MQTTALETTALQRIAMERTALKTLQTTALRRTAVQTTTLETTAWLDSRAALSGRKCDRCGWKDLKQVSKDQELTPRSPKYATQVCKLSNNKARLLNRRKILVSFSVTKKPNFLYFSVP